MCAVTCFNTILNNDKLTKKTRDYLDLFEFMDSKIKDFNDGLIKIDKKGLVDNNGAFV